MAVQHFTYGAGGTVEIYIPNAVTNTATVSCYTGEGGAVFETANATLSTINTTTTAAAVVGATSLAVSNAANIAVGSRFWIGGAQEVLVKSISSNTLTLRRPLLDAVANAASCKGTRLTYTVTAAVADTLFWDGRLEWLIDDGGAAEAVYTSACCCTKYPLQQMASEVDLFDEEPKLADVLDSEVDVDRLLSKAHSDVINRLNAATQNRGLAYIGADVFVDAVVFAALMRHYRSQHDGELHERYKLALEDELKLLLAGSAVRDEDQDGAVEENEQRAYRSIRLYRG